jgi:methionyl-tRNA formyltransferase
MRVIFMGTPHFAVPALSAIVGQDHEVVAVYTRAPQPAGRRGLALTRSPVQTVAEQFGIPVFTPKTLRDEREVEIFRSHEADVAVVVAYGLILPKPILAAPIHGCVNLHASLLPRWRGAAPIERAIEAGDEITGVTIMRPIAELDAGPICLQRDEPIRLDDDFGSLAARLAELGGQLLVEVLDRRPECTPQPEVGVTIAPKIESDERRLDPAAGPQALVRRVRALNPHVGTWIELDGGERLGVRKAQVAAESAAPAELVSANGRLLWGCAGGALELLVVQPPGGRAMTAAEFLRGHGARLVRGG